MDANEYKQRMRVELADLTNEVWENDTLAQGLRQALEDYNEANPDEVIGTVTLASSTREVSIATLAGYIDILRVWLPYTAGSPEDPPRWRHEFEVWPGDVLYIADDPKPASGDVARIWYRKLRTIAGLDTATATTIQTEHAQLIITGAVSYASSARAREISEDANANDEAYQRAAGFAFRKLNEFRAGLNNIRNSAAGRYVPIAPARRMRVRRS